MIWYCRAVGVAALLLAATVRAEPALWSLDLHPVHLVSERTDGGKLAVGDHFSISLDPGVGAWSDDGTRVLLTVEAEVFRWDPPLDLASIDAEGIRPETPWAISGPGFEGSLQGGILTREATILRWAPVEPASGKGGWVAALAVGGITLLLLRRGSSMRRRLAEPRVPLRRRSG